MRVEHTVAAPTADRARIESGRCRYLIRNPNSHEILRAQSLGLDVTRKMLSAELQRACRLHDEVERLASARGAAQVEAQERAPYRMRSYAVLRSPSVYAFTPVALFCCAVPCRLGYSFLSLVDTSCASRCAAQLLQCRSVGRGYTMRHARAHTTWGMARSIERCTLCAARCVDVCRMPYALCYTFITCCLPSYNRQHATCNRRHATCNRRCACSILRTRCTARNELLTLRSVAEQNRALQHQIEVCVCRSC